MKKTQINNKLSNNSVDNNSLLRAKALAKANYYKIILILFLSCAL